MTNYWCLNGGNYISPNSNLDNIKEIGSYFNHNNIESNTIINNPTNFAFTMQVYASNGHANNYVTQELRSYYSDDGIYIRKYSCFSKNWSKWVKMIQTNDFIAKVDASSSINVNDLTEPLDSRKYLISSLNPNGPPFSAYLEVYKWCTGSIKQVAIGYDSPRLAVRHRYNNVWSNWVEYQTK